MLRRMNAESRTYRIVSLIGQGGLIGEDEGECPHEVSLGQAFFGTRT